MSYEAITKHKTRQDTYCPIFGHPAELHENVLPTLGDTMRYYLLVWNILKPNDATKEPSSFEVSEAVTQRCEQLWYKSSIPVIGHKRVVEKVWTHHEKLHTLRKPFKMQKGDQKYQSKPKSFGSEANCQLFDIAACKCSSDTCNGKEVLNRSVNHKTNADWSGVVAVLSKKIPWSEKQKRQHETYLRLNTEQASTSAQHFDDTQTDLDSDDSSSTDLLTDDLDKMIDDVSGREHQVTKQSQMRLTLSNVARECDRHGVSDRCAASLMSAVQDVGLIHD